MEEEKLLENITKSISSRLKVPIIATYCAVLIFYNWDIIFYLLFKQNDALDKINYIKNQYSSEYFMRIFICLLISISLIVFFTMINTFLNFCLKWFYRKDKEITLEIESFEKIGILTAQLSQALEKNKTLADEIINLQKINATLSSRDLNVNISEISKKDYNTLLNFINSSENKEKLKFSLKELLEILKKNPKVELSEVYDSATYVEVMKNLIAYLVDQDLLKILSKPEYRLGKSVTVSTFNLSQSFKDFLKM